MAVAGLSVGRAVVTTLAHEGIGGELRLADFDALDLSNLNRITGGVADVGINKVVLAAREVAELDPYIRVVGFPDGVDDTTIGDFVDGADVIVDECDDLEMKVRLREYARAARVPVVMATSHRGMLDVERFDLEPDRPPFHGLLGDVSSAQLSGLTTKQKVPYVIRILDPASLTERAAASLVEVKESISTWPQLASDVALGGAMVANAVRRIALGDLTVSGRFYADLDALTPVPLRPARASRSRAARPRRRRRCPPPATRSASSSRARARRRPAATCSPGASRRSRTRSVRSSTASARRRCWTSATAARCSRSARRWRRPTSAPARSATRRACARTRTPSGSSSSSARRVPATRRRSSSCGSAARTGAAAPSSPIARHELAELAHCGAPLHASVLTGDALGELGAALGALDRVRFLSSRLRRDMIGELRFTPGSRDGIDVDSLELDAADRAALDVLRTGAGMEFLAAIDRGHGLGTIARDAFATSAGAIVLRADANAGWSRPAAG